MDATKIRDAANGGLIIEIPGPDGNVKTDVLARKLISVFGDDVSIACSTKMGKIQLFGLDISISEREIRYLIYL